MAAKNKELPVLDIQPQPIQEYENFDDDDFGDDELSRIQAILGSTNCTLKISLYRANKDTRKEAYLCPLDATDFSLDEIKRRFGGGEFVVKGYDERSKLRLNQRVIIEGDPVAPQIPNQHVASNSPTLAEIASLMQENTRAMLAGLVQIMPQPVPAQSRNDYLQEMLTLKNLFSNDAPRDGGGIEGIMKGIELARSITPREGGVDGMEVLLEAVKSLAPVLSQAVMDKNKPATAHRPKVQAIPAPVAATKESTIEGEADMQIMLKFYLAKLVTFAKEERDPALYAEVVADNVPESDLFAILDMLDPVGHLAGIHADVGNYRPWFENLIKETRLLFELTEPVIGDSVIEITSENNLDVPKRSDKIEAANDPR